MQEIIISRQLDKKNIAIVEQGILQEIYEESSSVNRLEGNIYCGVVKDILPGMQAAFIDIGQEKNAFLHIKDLLPKSNELTGNKNEDLKKYNIKDYIKKDECILVQVKKDASGSKNAKISKDINIPGRFIAIHPNDNFITVSQKIENEEEKKRLVNIVKKITNNKIGIIIRTAASNKTEEELKKDIEKTILKWKDVNEKFNKVKDKNKPQVLYKNDSIIYKILLDTIDNGINKIYVDNQKEYENIEKIIDKINKNNNVEIQIKEAKELCNMYDLNNQIERIKNRKIWLKCGGFITIDKTEALTAIDVNSGKFTGKESLEKTILKVNQEASIEIAKQLRLRDIGGIIVIDYIDMHDEKSREKVLETLNLELKKDRSKTQILDFTKLDLLEMTRKHMFSK